MKKKILSVLLMMMMIMVVVAPMSAFADTGALSCADVFGAGTNGGTAGTTINNTLKDVVKIIAGAGASLFTIAVMVLAVMIMFGSISPSKKGIYWGSLIGSVCGAFVFFGAFKFSDAIAQMAQGGKCV
ncbi:TrbC/VirB2 family protein [Paenibacillus sp. LS1]|uniref:TrbC/VirB2 family protein n=1 Tax=Paenibacillus sp. LS1 TaxID=2992120 RepID=UPI00222F0305|nr:TrbC/VirB2 family protein [Paenibacillus sp. LS1]MCW3793729.1 TrbC/VirB2 family protein [Paenibacillus sp. LS1]